MGRVPKFRAVSRKQIMFGIVSVVVLTLSAISFRALTTQAAPPSDFDSTTFLSGLHDPTAFRFAPDGSVYIAEKGGAIVHYANGTLTTLITLPTPTDYERGLLGIELDQNFIINHYIYASYTNTDGYSRLSRFTVSGETIDPASEFIFLKLNQPSDIYHNANDVHAGPDGKIWWSVGDGQVPANAQSLSSGHGKILRFDTDGTSANDNTWHGQFGKVDQIYALGFRNPFRFTFLPTGKAIVGDVGLDSYEEMDIIENGANYGWPTVEGDCGSCGFVNPVFQYAHNGQNSSISALGMYTGSTFGPEYQNALFYGDYARGTLRYLKFDSSYTSVVSDNAFEDAAGTIVDIHTGPDGNLYYASIFEGTITKVSPAGGNRAPIAKAAASPIAGLSPLTVQLSSSGSVDPEGATLTYAWDFGDGSTSTEANPSHTYTVNGKYTPTLTVSDGAKTASAPTSVTVGNRLPTATILTPTTGTKYNAGDTISYSGTASDPEDGSSLPASAFSWKVILHHADHIHPYIGPVDGVKSGTFTIDTGTNNEATTYYEIELTVTDSGGLQSVTSVNINPNLSTMTITSGTPGGQFTVDGRLFIDQYVSQEVVGVKHGLSVPSPQTINGANYRFLSWSDGGAQTHVYQVPSADATVTSQVFQTAPIPAPWTSVDIGSPTNVGNADYDTARQAFLIDGGGNDIWATTDQFHYVYQPLSGDGEIVTRVTSQTPADPWTKSGIMVKQAATANSPYVMIAVTPGNGIVMQHSFNSDIGSKPAYTFPTWLKLKRVGNVFTGYYSSNGTTWTQLAQATVSMTSAATSGLFVTAHTDAALSTTAFDSVSVTPTTPVPNTAPVAQNLSASTARDTPVGVTLAATDDQGDPLTYSVVAQPAHGTLTGTAPNLTYTPASGYTGSDSFTYKANDGKLDSNVATVSLIVTPPVGTLPVGWQHQDIGTVTPGAGNAGYDSTSSTYTVTGGGYDIWFDRDDFHYAYQALNGDGQIVARISSQVRSDPYAKAGVMIKQSTTPFSPYAFIGITPDHGYQFQWTFLQDSAGGNAYTAPNAWVKLTRVGDVFTAYSSPDGTTWTQVGIPRTISMTAGATIGLFSASHNSGALSTATFNNVTITSNVAPVAQNQTVSATTATAKAITLGATDVNNDPLTYTVLTQPTHGTLSGTAPNVTYTSATGYIGPDSFTFKANDGKLDSNTATVTLNVSAANAAPVAQNQTVSATTATAKAITLGATDANNDPLTYSIVTQPAHGTLTGTAPNLTYTSAVGYIGPDSFTFKANDGKVDSNTATVTLNVAAANAAPVAQNKSITTTAGTAVAATLSATDANNDPLTYSVVTSPTHGTLTGTAPNLTYTPASGYTGSDSFTYKANDGKVDSNIATVSITVTPPATTLPSPWVQADVGAVAPTGSGTYNATSKVFSLSGGGLDIWNTHDDFHYVYQPLIGDGQIVARVTSQTNTGTAAKAGVMIKQSTTPFSNYGLIGTTPAHVYRSQWSFSNFVTNGTYAFPNAWVKLTRVGNTVSAYRSTNGTTWTRVSQKTITMSSNATIGLFVTSGTSGALSSATFDNVTVVP